MLGLIGIVIKRHAFCVAHPDFPAGLYPFVASFTETLAGGIFRDFITRLPPLAVYGIANPEEIKFLSGHTNHL